MSGNSLTEAVRTQLVHSLRQREPVTRRYGLCLTGAELARVAEARVSALTDTGRIELGRSAVADIAYAFCDSPWVSRDSWADTLCALAEAFFYFKNASDDTIPDDDLIRLMRAFFDRHCGSLEYLESADIYDLVRNSPYGHSGQEKEL